LAWLRLLTLNQLPAMRPRWSNHMQKWRQRVMLPHPPALLKSEADPARREEVVRVLQNHLPKSWDNNESLLAVGCGDGYEVDVLNGMGWASVVGLTVDETEWKKGDGKVVLGDMHDMTFKDASYGYTYSKETLEHTPAPFIALVELNRVTKLGGGFFHLISCGLEKQREMYHLSCLPEWMWFDLFKKAGFEVTEILNGHETEIGFIGRKVRTVEPFQIPERWSYDLRSEHNAVKKSALRL
jgi:hypothetical protein